VSPAAGLRLSVVVPVRNERAFIRPCLDSILADAPEGGLEIIVVDGMSDDGTDEIVSTLAAVDPRVRLIRNPSRFVPQAMNLGIAEARGEHIGRVDGHCLVEPGYFSGCLERLDSGDWDCVGGVLLNEGSSAAGRAIAAATSSPVGVGSARFRTGGAMSDVLVDTLAFGVYRREVFERIGLFDEQFVRNQDDELNLRLTRSGGRILLVPSLRIRYHVRDSIRMLFRQYYQYGFWKWRVFRKHGRPGSIRQLAPTGFVIALSAALILSPVSRLARLALPLLLLPYALALGVEALRLRIRRGAPWGRTVAALATLHFAYGTGLLAAMVTAALPGRGGPARGPTSMSR